jgi:hypothetical protein
MPMIPSCTYGETNEGGLLVTSELGYWAERKRKWDSSWLLVTSELGYWAERKRKWDSSPWAWTLEQNAGAEDLAAVPLDGPFSN